ncbi:MAG: hypothetical protein IJ688_08685 [Treponema sp.]|nr:hypothetical protein [Treponema sp.]
MKKIVGIIGAAAVLASSIFAADVSAKVNLLGDLFSYGEYQDWNAGGVWKKNITAIGIAEGGQSWNPSFSMTASGDQAGASMKFFDSGATEAVSNINYSIWFKPIDILKITVGNFTSGLSQETIDYSNGATGIDSNGVALSLSSGGFNADVFLVSGWSSANFGWDRVTKINGWFTKADKADPVIGETYIKLSYAIDGVGTIGAYADLNTNQKYTDWGNGGVVVYCPGADFGVGYDNTFGNVKMFVNVLTGFDDDWNFGIVRAEAFATTNIDALGLSAFVVGGYATEKVKTDIAQDKLANVAGFGKGAFVGFTAKATYGINGCTPYLYLKCDNALADSFSLEAKPGVAFNVGSCSLDVAVDLYIQEHFKFDVPVVCSVAF